jgi:flagellar biogenesis protein FliO
VKSVPQGWGILITACVGLAPSLSIAQLAQGPANPDINAVRVVAALVVSLAIGVAVILLLRRRLAPGRRSTVHSSIRVVESARLSGRAMLHAVEFDGKRILVATDSGSIVLLAEGRPVSSVGTDSQ